MQKIVAEEREVAYFQWTMTCVGENMFFNMVN